MPSAGIDLTLEASFEDQEFVTLIAKPGFWEGRVAVRGGAPPPCGWAPVLEGVSAQAHAGAHSGEFLVLGFTAAGGPTSMEDVALGRVSRRRGHG